MYINKIVKVIMSIMLSMLLLVFMVGCQPEEPRQPQKTETSEFEDGTYTGYSNATEHGYAWAKVTIKDDDITDVKLMEITSKGNEKDYETYQYEPSVKAHEEMPEKFERANSADVENYSGATHSSEKFKQAVERALIQARGGYTGKYFDGTFQGRSDKTEYGYAVALVTIKDDKITDVELKEVNGEGEWKDFSQYDWEPAVEANEEMPERFIEANSYDVDTYSKATQSSIKYKEAVKRALEHARKNPEKEVK
ncbi:FMN-binding protein [Halothermothrix orenii]|uniref:FMN-binding domain protein n=1 Tax=Halothermothrix orenii (strain H 168 / OCM 544 / DSM 9562) TaxID=373903 RepID=B8CZA9_HALOH|nr:FMN-binding protein [Halothermothrix orenii]ACL70628.1 FMN-binding domain protein [Halothermothrix orenii H 168]